MRGRTLADMATDTRRLADLENATERFPDSEVYELINKGIAKVYSKMVVVADRPFFTREIIISLSAPIPPGSIASYPLPDDFLQILSVGWTNSGGGLISGPWSPLEPCEEADYIQLTNAGFYGGIGPRKYSLVGNATSYTQGTIPTSYSISILPTPTIGSLLKVRYIPTPGRLVNPTDTFDGILGFEDAACTWAAILMRRKDDLDTADLQSDMVFHFANIAVIAKRRDRSRPPKISVVRGRSGSRRGGNRGFGVW